MEKIKINDHEYEILNIQEIPPLLKIAFPTVTSLGDIDLEIIEVFTEGGEKCRELTEYTTIYRELPDIGNVVTLSSDGSVYVEPIEPEPAEPHEPTPEEIAQQLVSAKKSKITPSKALLDTYLAEYPLLFTDGKYYSVTREKQNLLNNAIAIYQIKVQTGDTNAILKWNATGEECTIWTLDSITELALAIAAYVEPLVAKQQSLEVQINDCNTQDELEGIVIAYEAAI